VVVAGTVRVNEKVECAPVGRQNGCGYMTSGDAPAQKHVDTVWPSTSQEDPMTVPDDEQVKPISLFYSYSHRDEDLRGKLETHLAVLRRGGLIDEWHDRKIEAGDEWRKQIDGHLRSADIVLLLVSADFIASDYCWSEEMTKALGTPSPR
jgi:hypothetical protein